MTNKDTDVTVHYDTNVQVENVNQLKTMLASNYQKTLNNYFGNEQKALEFLSGVITAVQGNPELLKCNTATVINSFMRMASLKFMPSEVSGEAYVLPYKSKAGMVAQFQLGYQGLVTLFYRAGVRSIVSEIVYEKDSFTYINGVVEHNPDIFAADRGEAKGAYVIVELQAGGKVSKVMSKEAILDIGKKFSKSFNSEYSPWNAKNDPQLWQWKKTVLKQCAKLVPKNETIYKAIAEDNADSIVSDRIKEAKAESESIKMAAYEVKKLEDNAEPPN